MSKASEARAFRRGALAAALTSARDAMTSAAGRQDLLTDRDRKALRTALELVRGLEQRAWGAP
jgi:hypothetical protein